MIPTDELLRPTCIPVPPEQYDPPPVTVYTLLPVLTVTTLVEEQPETGREYVIELVPRATPVITPPLLIVAIAGFELVHVPPVGVLDNVVVPPTHTRAVPVIAPGVTLTVTFVVTVPVPGTVYDIKTIPLDMPVITPVLIPMVAMPGVVLVHVPPGVASVSVAELPTHIMVGPVIGACALDKMHMNSASNVRLRCFITCCLRLF